MGNSLTSGGATTTFSTTTAPVATFFPTTLTNMLTKAALALSDVKTYMATDFFSADGAGDLGLRAMHYSNAGNVDFVDKAQYWATHSFV